MKLASVWLNEEWFNAKVSDENAGTAVSTNIMVKAFVALF